MLLLQATDEVTRPTFWRIGPIGKAVFYYLAAVAIAVFLVSSYQRVRQYTDGSRDEFPRLNALPRRVAAAAVTVLSNRSLRDGDVIAGVETMRVSVITNVLITGIDHIKSPPFGTAIDEVVDLVEVLVMVNEHDRRYIEVELLGHFSNEIQSQR
jgi:hypothetical protein